MFSKNGRLWHTASVDNPILIAIEGIDGAGKTTQAQMLSDALKAAGLDVVPSKEPTNGAHGRRIKGSASSGRLPLEEELHAFVEDRKEHVRDVIQPALDEGKIVVLDRYYYSTIAYQGARGKNVDEIRRAMEAFAPVPDVVFLLDVEPQVGLSRIAESRNEMPNRFENLETLTAVRDVFMSLSDRNIVRIDGSLSIEDVHVRILTAFVDGVLKSKCSFDEWSQLSRRLRAGLVEATLS